MAILNKEQLDELFSRYNNHDFIEKDPISIPHQFSTRGDIEISAFLVSLIAWGNRKMIIRSGNRMIERMDSKPDEFIRGASSSDIKRAAEGFVHRTFSSEDFSMVLQNLQKLYKNYGSLGDYFQDSYAKSQSIKTVLSAFRSNFLCGGDSRHISSIEKGSACKRLCMFLRWMVRHDAVDFGLWKGIPTSALYIPLDVHSSRQGRELGLLNRKSNDWKAVEELTASLRSFDANDPVRYDFALFGLGVSEDKL